MKEHNENPLYKYMWDNFVNEGYKMEFTNDECKKKKNSDIIFLKSNALFTNYKYYLTAEEKGYIKPTYKILKTILSDIGINKKNVKISGVNSDYYIININELKEQLEHYNFNTEIEEFNDDDFE